VYREVTLFDNYIDHHPFSFAVSQADPSSRRRRVRAVGALLVWTTNTTAQIIRAYEKASKGMRDYIEETIHAAKSGELSGTRSSTSHPRCSIASLDGWITRWMDYAVVTAPALGCDEESFRSARLHLQQP
jgi:hypothetical protein